MADQVKQVIQAQLRIDAVSESASFVDDLGADSLDVIAMVTEFEEGFEVEIPNEDIPKLQTVGDAITYVVGLLG